MQPSTQKFCMIRAILGLSIKAPNGMYEKYYPSGAFSCRDQAWLLLMRNWIACDSGASIKALNGMYDKYYPSRAFSCHRNICTTLTRNWTPTHRRHFCRALYMQPSTQKFSMIRGHSRPLNQSSEWNVRKVLSIRSFFMSRPSLTPSDAKLDCL